VPTSVRDWADVDYYGLLGVAPEASDEEIARAFRALAKQLHPDRVGSRTTDEQQRFKQITAAYEVLSNPRMRRDYDSVQQRDETGVRPRPEPMGRVPKPPETPLINWTPAKARIAMFLGVLCFLGGVAMSVFMVGVHAREADAGKGRVKVSAFAEAAPNGDVVVTFETTDGKTVTIPPPHRINPSGTLTPGQSLTLRYLRTNPTNVITDESHFARDFTLWFVAVKLLFGGPVIFLVGYRRMRKFRRLRATVA
jgi:hypothetical protein